MGQRLLATCMQTLFNPNVESCVRVRIFPQNVAFMLNEEEHVHSWQHCGRCQTQATQSMMVFRSMKSLEISSLLCDEIV